MRRVRRNRLIAVLFVFTGAAVFVGLVLFALDDSLNLFYPPDQVVAGAAPIDQTIRAGGMVAPGSVRRGDDLAVQFDVTDFQGATFTVRYSGILPDLFGEEQGVLVRGQLREGGVFDAVEVLAKHDENYMPPELAELKGVRK